MEYVRMAGQTVVLQWNLVGSPETGLALAVKAAATSDVVVAVVGGSTETCGEV